MNQLYIFAINLEESTCSGMLLLAALLLNIFFDDTTTDVPGAMAQWIGCRQNPILLLLPNGAA